MSSISYYLNIAYKRLGPESLKKIEKIFKNADINKK